MFVYKKFELWINVSIRNIFCVKALRFVFKIGNFLSWLFRHYYWYICITFTEADIWHLKHISVFLYFNHQLNIEALFKYSCQSSRCMKDHLPWEVQIHFRRVKESMLKIFYLRAEVGACNHMHHMMKPELVTYFYFWIRDICVSQPKLKNV